MLGILVRNSFALSSKFIVRRISTESKQYPGLFYHSIPSSPESTTTTTTTPTTPRYALSFLPTPAPSLSFSPTTIGILSHPNSASKNTISIDQIPPILPRYFEENPDFIELLHDLLKEIIAKDEGMATLAKVRAEGYLHIADERNPADPNRVPDPSDIIASILIRDSRVLTSAYEISRTHRLVTMQGMMKLPESVHREFVKGLERVRQVEIQMHKDESG